MLHKIDILVVIKKHYKELKATKYFITANLLDNHKTGKLAFKKVVKGLRYLLGYNFF